ncbi:hypothetical protein A4X06_0g9216, partial [Tilletia controversa]
MTLSARAMYDDMHVFSAWCTTTPFFAYAYDDATEAAKKAMPSSGKTEIDLLSPIEEEIEGSYGTSATGRSGRSLPPPLSPRLSSPQQQRWYPASSERRAEADARLPQDDLIDLTVEMGPFGGFRPVSGPIKPDSDVDYADRPVEAPDESEHEDSAPARQDAGRTTSRIADQQTGAELASDYLSAAGFELSDPALVRVTQDPGAVKALAMYLQRALSRELSSADRASLTSNPLHQRKDLERDGSVVTFAEDFGSQPAVEHTAAPRVERQQATSAAPSSRSGIHRLPESIAGGLAFNRPLGPNDRAGSYHPPPGILRRTPSQPAEQPMPRPSPARAFFEPRPIVRPSQWSSTPGPAAPGVQFDPRLMPPPPESMAGSYGTSHGSFGGGRGPVIKPSIEYAGEADLDLYESFVFDLQRVFRTYPSNVSEATKVSVLGGQLTGKARIFFNSKDYYYSDWQTVCEELQVRYLPLVAPELTWNKFWNVQQWDEEQRVERPIHEVIQELEAHQLRLGPSCNNEIMRMRLLGAFSDRMNDAMVQ